MAIQHRRGDYNDYRPNKMLSGELAVTLQHDPRAVDGKALHVAFAPGDEKTLMTFEDAEIMIEDATEIATQEAIEYASAEAEAWAHGNGFTNNDYFSGDGTTTSFTLTYTPVSIVDVEISGSTTSAYSLSGKVLTFTTAPASGTDNIRIEYTVDNTNDNAKKYKEQAGDSATAASGSANSASTNALKSEGFAVGQQNGTDVGSDSDYYHNNAKYYKEQAASSEQTATTKAGDASVSATLAQSYAKGGTNTRTGEDTDNAKYYKERAEAAASSAEYVFKKTASGAIATFNDGGDDIPVKDLTVAIEPVQDLHGYDNPWPAGGGKNLIPMTVAGVKAVNTFGTWSGNAYVYNGVTWTLSTDGDGNVIAIKSNGTASGGNSGFFLYRTQTLAELKAVFGNNSCIATGCPSGGSSTTYFFRLIRLDPSYIGKFTDTGSGADINFNSITDESAYDLRLNVDNGKSVSNLMWYPMIRLATESDATFVPYTNICPITGWTGVNVSRTGKNLNRYPYDIPNKSDGGITYTKNSDGSIRVTGTSTASVDFSYHTRRLQDNGSLWLPKGTYIYSCECHGKTFSASEGFIYLGTTYNNAFKKVTDDTAFSNSGEGCTLTIDDNFQSDYKRADGSVLISAYVRFTSGVAVGDVTLYPMIRRSSDSYDKWEAYKGTTYPITFPTPPGTVYGGTIDVTSGVLTVDRVTHQLDGTEELNHADVGELKDRFDRRLTSLGWENGINSIHSRSSHYKRGVILSQPYGVFMVTADGYLVIHNNDHVYANVTDYKSYLAAQYAAGTPVQFCYKLATPITYQCTPQEVRTLLGVNNIWADAGDSTVEYYTNNEMYGDLREQIDTTAAIILGDFATVEASTTASQAYAVGDYLTYDGYLYKVTVAIASGGTIVVSGAGANVEQTNVGKEIKNRELWYPTQAIASTSGSAGTLATITDARITADHVLTKFVAANSSYITSDITSTTSAGQAALTGTSTAATTAEIVLTKKDN